MYDYCRTILFYDIYVTSSAKTSLMKVQTVFPGSDCSVYLYLYSYIVFELCRKMLIRDKKSRLCTAAAQNARHVIRACSFLPSISWVCSDVVTYLNEMYLITFYDKIFYNWTWQCISAYIDQWKHNHAETCVSSINVFTHRKY